jgi:hypothetical protein
MSVAIRLLMSEVVDYAGLFPPAQLPLDRVVVNFDDYFNSPQRWMLGRLIVPLGKIDECASQAASFVGAKTDPWKISCLLPRVESIDSDPLRNHWRKIAEFNSIQAGRFSIDAVEVAVGAAEQIPVLAAALIQSKVTTPIELFVELPHAEDCSAHFEQLAAAQGVAMRAKIRMGGITANLFPEPEQVARFLTQAAQFSVPFKATAGLHHPVRAEYPVSYEDNCPRVIMHGFLNVLVASMMAKSKRLSESQLVTLLEETVASEFEITDESLCWRGITIPVEEILAARRNGFRSFGSCSFIEPVEDLQSLGYLPEDSDEPISHEA